MGGEFPGFDGYGVMFVGNSTNISQIIETRRTEKFDGSSEVKGLNLVDQGSNTGGGDGDGLVGGA